MDQQYLERWPLPNNWRINCTRSALESWELSRCYARRLTYPGNFGQLTCAGQVASTNG